MQGCIRACPLACCDGLGSGSRGVVGLRRKAGQTVLCHETIHRFIYTQVARTKDYRWGRLLPTGRTRQR